MQIAKRVYSLAQEQNDAALMVGPTALWQPRRIFWAISRPRDKRDPWSPDLALGGRTVSGQRGL
jgi:hypothetical protein